MIYFFDLNRRKNPPPCSDAGLHRTSHLLRPYPSPFTLQESRWSSPKTTHLPPSPNLWIAHAHLRLFYRRFLRARRSVCSRKLLLQHFVGPFVRGFCPGPTRRCGPFRTLLPLSASPLLWGVCARTQIIMGPIIFFASRLLSSRSGVDSFQSVPSQERDI